MYTRLLFFIVVLITGCSVKSLSPQDIKCWVENPGNGLYREKIIGGFEIAAQYRPIDYIITTEAKGKPISNLHYKKRVQELSGMDYYQLRIKASTGDPLLSGEVSQPEYHARNNFMMFGQKDFIYLVHGNDTIPCSVYHFINYQGMAPYADILLGFSSANIKSKSNDQELIYDDQLFNLGPLHFTFSENEIESVPSLDLK